MSSLEQLLSLLAEGRIRTLVELASDLDVGTELVEQMVADLERAGYLEIISQPCNRCCDECSLSAKPCALGHGGRMWAVTEKGFRAADEAVP